MAIRPTTGIPSFIGYEYQILATVWVGLELVVRRGVSDHIVIEPVSEEDIAAQLDDEQVSTSVKSSAQGGYAIEIQIKLRRTSHWTPSSFVRVLNGAEDEPGTRGPVRRVRPIQKLIDTPHLRFAMLTDARVSDALRDFRVAEVGELSTASVLPGDLEAPDPAGTARQIGVLTERTPEVLRLRIAECLRFAHVPGTKHEGCIERLQRAVRSRLLGEMPDRWERAEIESILAEYDGFPNRRAISPLIPPNNYAELLAQLATKHVLLVTGPPGSGKTHAASHLAQAHRLNADPYEVVEVQGGDGVGRVRSRLDGEGRVLFLIHDPWGMYESNDRAQEWASDLPKLVIRANAGKKFLITSRTAIKEEHLPAEFRNALTSADMSISEENYSEADCNEILRHSLQAAGPLQLDFVVRHRQRILTQLRLPLAIESFAQGLMTCSMAPEPSLEELIRSSNVEAIGQKVQQEVEARGKDAIAGAIVLWSLFSPRQALSLAEARLGRLDAAQGGYTGRTDPEELMNHFIRSKRLSPTDGEAFYAHPTFIEGLDRVVWANPGVADDVMSALLAGMCANDRLEKTRGILRHLRRRSTPIPPAAQAALNRHLLDQIGRADRFDAEQAFRDLAGYGDGNDPVILLVRALMKGPSHHRNGFSAFWQPEQMSQSVVSAISASADALEAAQNFVRYALFDRVGERYRAQDLVSFFDQFDWELTPQFIRALGDTFERQPLQAPMFAEAALLGVQPPYEDVLAIGLDELDRVQQSLEQMGDELRRADQGELNGEHSSHIFEQANEQLYEPEQIIELVVTLRRAREGYDWLVGHPRIPDLLEPWVETLGVSTSEDEVRSILSACSDKDRRPGWRAIVRTRATGFIPLLMNALSDAPEYELLDILRAIDAVIPRADWPVRVEPVVSPQPLLRRVQIALAISDLDMQAMHGTENGGLLSQLFQPAEAAALKACERWEGSDSIRGLGGSLGEPEKAVLLHLAASSDGQIGVRAALVLHELGEDTSGYLGRWVNSPGIDTRILAYHLASLSKSEHGYSILKNEGLKDPDYRCRRVALQHLAQNATEGSWALVLQAATDASGPVRECCARLIGNHSYQPGEQTLRTLIRDTRDISEDHCLTIYGGHDFHVARAAAKALDLLPCLSLVTTADLIDFVRDGERVCPDRVVHYHVVNCLARRATQELQEFFVELLADERYLPGPTRAGFPIRYAAAWGVANSLAKAPARADSIDLRKIIEGARHPDPRLAGPCIIALGFADPRGRDAMEAEVRRGEDWAERGALYVLAAAYSTDTAADSFIGIVGTQHPALAIAAYLDPEVLTTDATWTEWVEQRPRVKSWLDKIQSSEDVHPALRHVLSLLMGGGDREVVLRSSLQANDLAESSPLITTRRLLGGE